MTGAKRQRRGQQPTRDRQVKREHMDLVRIDPAKLLWYRQRIAKSKTAFADHLMIDRKVIYRIEDGLAIKRTTAMDIARALETSVEELLLTTGVTLSVEEQLSPWKHPEWEVIPGTFSSLRVMSNGLVMRTAKVRHRVLSDEYGRAKLYDIAGMAVAVRNQCKDALVRHATVCRRLRECPYISTNLTMTALQDESIWTMVDSWVDGASLAEALDANAVSREHFESVLTEVGSGIKALHAAQIVLRELQPESILYCPVTSCCVLMDLELAKLLDFDTTVSSRWVNNPYRAPEVAGGTARPQADIYSFARLIVRLLVGTLPELPDDAEQLRSYLPGGCLLDVTSRALSPNWKKRPASIDHLLAALPELRGNDAQC